MNTHSKSWFDRFIHLLLPEPKDQAQLMEVLQEAQANHILNMDALRMIKGVVEVSESQAKDIMIPRSQMVTIHENASLKEIIPVLIDSNHSRFPVLSESEDKVVGVLLAKDLLPYGFDDRLTFDMSKVLRSVLIIPESKRLDILLREFQEKRTHMAVVWDEYGNLAGLVTMEDILELIIGEIEDEYDTEEEENNIRQMEDQSHYLVKALTPIKAFNEYFQTEFSDEEVDTVGGLVMQVFGHLPKNGQTIEIGAFQFKVVLADERRVHLLRVRKL
jgi:magnesium and cobalt transporter